MGSGSGSGSGRIGGKCKWAEWNQINQDGTSDEQQTQMQAHECISILMCDVSCVLGIEL